MFTVQQYREVQAALNLLGTRPAGMGPVEAAIEQHHQALQTAKQAAFQKLGSLDDPNLVVIRPQNSAPIGGFLFSFQYGMYDIPQSQRLKDDGIHLILSKDVDLFPAFKFYRRPMTFTSTRYHSTTFINDMPMLLSLHYYVGHGDQIKTQKFYHGLEWMGPEYAENRADYPYIDKSILSDLDRRIGDWFGPRMARCCAELKIEHWGELVQKTEKELLKLKGISKATLETVKEVLDECGLTLGMTVDPSWTPPNRRFNHGWEGTSIAESTSIF